jgi:pentose-5-phosphate-3-epimerase/CBS domain-containing protein
MLVSGSLFAVKDNFLDYASQLKFAKADYLHIDLFQNDHDFKLEDVLIFDESYLPLDVHLIYEEITGDIIDVINKSTAAYLTVQYENMKNKDLCIKAMKKFKGGIGIAIIATTDIEMIEKYINDINHVLIMCSEPGVSGAKFNDKCYERIKTVRNKHPNLKIHVDGGVEANIAETMNGMGISMVISGSYLAKNLDNLHKSIYNLKYSNENNISVKRNMIKFPQLPVIKSNTKFFDVITCINQGKIGCCFVVDNSKLLGIVTDGDIRRAYLKYGKNVFDIPASDIMNIHPFVVSSSATIADIHEHLVENGKWWIRIVPVIEDDLLIGVAKL